MPPKAIPHRGGGSGRGRSQPFPQPTYEQPSRYTESNRHSQASLPQNQAHALPYRDDAPSWRHRPQTNDGQAAQAPTQPQPQRHTRESPPSAKVVVTDMRTIIANLSTEEATYYENACQSFQFLFNSTAFSNFEMVDYLLEKSNTSYDELWMKPTILGERVQEKHLRDDGSEEYDYLIKSPGRCTTFAISVAKMLEEEQSHHGDPESDGRLRFNFQYYDLGYHRLARCDNTGITIDSSARVGPVVLSAAGGKFVRTALDNSDRRDLKLQFKAGVLRQRRLQKADVCTRYFVPLRAPQTHGFADVNRNLAPRLSPQRRAWRNACVSLQRTRISS
jgi:hypothetical protein